MKIFCDFDGTITNRDSIVFLTERFGGGSVFRSRILKQIASKEITIFDAIEQELGSITVTWEEAVKSLREEVRIDPTFPEFVGWCKAEKLPLTVVSSGIRPVIELFLNGLQVPVYAHQVEPDPKGWRYRLIEDQEKSGIVEKACRDSRTIYIGDGASDIKVARMVDILFARRGFYLAQYCEEENIPFLPFSSFTEIQEKLAGLLK